MSVGGETRHGFVPVWRDARVWSERVNDRVSGSVSELMSE